MFFKKYEQVGSFGTNNYLFIDEASKEAALVDCSGEVKQIQKFLAEFGASLKYILLTHAHFDHIAACQDFLSGVENFGPAGAPKLCLHKEDKMLLDGISIQCTLFGLPPMKKPQVDVYIDEKSELSLGEYKIQVIHTPGHSKGSVCYLIDNKLCSGDTLFYEEIGRCDLPGGNFKEIEKSIRERIFTLPDDIPVYPGHGKDSTIAHEKEHNAYFGARASR
jgi:glyoxylase-like metal-dependent hydrolase (beta-lactamase superfamily II)